MEYVPALYGILVLVAFLGWGELAMLEFGKQPSAPGTLVFLGAAVVIFVGGVLNLLHALTLISTLALLLIGLAAAFRWPGRIWKAAPRLVREARDAPIAAFALLLAVASILVLYVSYCRGWSFNVSDDFTGYLTWPEKALQTGWLGDDPFSQRRFSGLGANCFLQSLVVRFFPLQNVTVIEPGVAMLMISLFAYEKCAHGSRRFAWAALGLAVFACCFAIAPRANTSSLILSLGYVMALVVVCCETAVGPLCPKKMFGLALLATPLVSLKGNVAPFAPIALVLYFAVRAYANKAAVREALITAVLYIALALPWLVSAHGSMGSWYYPFLGKSYLVTSYHDVDGLMRVEKGPKNFYYAFANCLNYPGFLAAITLLLGTIVAAAGRRARWLWVAWLALGYALIVFFLEKHRVLVVAWILSSMLITLWVGRQNRARPSPREGVWAAMLLAAWLCGFGVYMMLNGGLYQRYFFSVAYGCLFAGFLLVITPIRRVPAFPFAYSVAIGLFAFGFATYEVSFDGTPSNAVFHPQRIGGVFVEHFLNVLHGPDNAPHRLPPEPGHPWLFSKLQAFVPPGKRILARTRFNFAFDFARNPVWIADQPGETSLPPGMPYGRGPDALAAYLQKLNICYIVYAYGPKGLRDASRSQLNDFYAWTRAEARMTMDFQANLESLAKKFPVIYSDPENFVLKLCD